MMRYHDGYYWTLMILLLTTEGVVVKGFADPSNAWRTRSQHYQCRSTRRAPHTLTDDDSTECSTASLCMERRELFAGSVRATSAGLAILGSPRRESFATSVFATTAGIATSLGSPQHATARALFSEDGSNRRQLELCLVVLLRVLYWVQLQADAFAALEPTDERQRQVYLETRLGAKAILTGKIGPGATGTTYTLATLQLPACLNDLEWHATQMSQSSSRIVADLRRDLTEALASCVEFDGLETLIDPSPRSALTLAQYTTTKAVFVRRVLTEQVVPRGTRLLSQFGVEPLQRSVAYTKQYYASEIPSARGIWSDATL